MDDYIESARKQFEYYKSLGDKTFSQLSDDELFRQLNPETNSVATIVKHLWGNMLSRWTDFLNSDGEKEWRNREAEFENDLDSREEMIKIWEEGWDCLFKALAEINESNFSNIIYIRNMGHTVVEAVNRQLAHYAYHVGQVVFLGKLYKNGDWNSLSIPRGKSSDYNAEKFSEPKRKQHFTDEFLKSSNGDKDS